MRRFVLLLVVAVAAVPSCKKSTPAPPPPTETVTPDDPAADNAAADASRAAEAQPAEPEPAATRPKAADPKVVVDLGVAGFEQGMCAKCHGANGEGSARAPDLTDAEWLHCDGTIAGIRAVLVNGVSKEQLKDPSRPHAMNPVTNLIEDDKMLSALAVYVWTLSQK